MTDLLALAAELVGIRSVSHEEAEIADRIEADLVSLPWLDVTRLDDNVVARTTLSRPQRLLLGGHLDTVQPSGNDRARIEGDVLWGLGAADMKGGLAVLSELARTQRDPSVDVTYLFYTGEEVDRQFSGLQKLHSLRPELLVADAAVLAEPTGGHVECGCQGTMRIWIRTIGVRAHTARPWAGTNAVHRLGPLLERVSSYVGRRPVIEECEYREALQAVRIEGGVANNVVPDVAEVVLNHRFAPDQTPEEAEANVRQLFEPVLGEGDSLTVEESQEAAPPGLGNPLLAALVSRSGFQPRAKLGWTDVATFSTLGIPATNFGPGDPEVAHSSGDRVTRRELEAAYAVLHRLLSEGPY